MGLRSEELQLCHYCQTGEYQCLFPERGGGEGGRGGGREGGRRGKVRKTVCVCVRGGGGREGERERAVKERVFKTKW